MLLAEVFVFSAHTTMKVKNQSRLVPMTSGKIILRWVKLRQFIQTKLTALIIPEIFKPVSVSFDPEIHWHMLTTKAVWIYLHQYARNFVLKNIIRQWSKDNWRFDYLVNSISPSNKFFLDWKECSTFQLNAYRNKLF